MVTLTCAYCNSKFEFVQDPDQEIQLDDEYFCSISCVHKFNKYIYILYNK